MMADAIPTDWTMASTAQRRMMVDCQVRTFDVTDHAIITAMLAVPREVFVARELASLAYADRPMPAAGGERQLLAPMILARMLQAANLRGADRVLDVAGGSGYGAAILARIAGKVVALESDAECSGAARAALAQIGAAQVDCVTGALEDGHAGAAPYDVIMVHGMIDMAPTRLLDQLADGGRLIAIDAGLGAPKAVRFERTGADFSKRPLFDASGPMLDAFRQAPSFVF